MKYITYTFFAPNIERLVKTIFKWEAKVITEAYVVAEMNWKHKVTPDWGNLMRVSMQVKCMIFHKNAIGQCDIENSYMENN